MAEEKKSLLEKLLQVQQDLKVPKAQYNDYGDFNYRSCEDILQAARPLCNANDLVLTLRDTVEPCASRFYIKAEAIITDVASGETFSTQAMAREADNKKGMDAAQVTGAASSYARKYALCALFAIDDTRDADSDEYAAKTRQDGAQSTKSAGVYNPPAGVKKGSESDVLRAQALKKIQDAQKATGITNADVKAIIGWKYQKDGFKSLALDEACDLAENLVKYVQEVRAA